MTKTDGAHFSKKQRMVLAFGFSDYDALICDGSVRSGKSSIMMFSFIEWAMSTFNNKIFAICGKTVSSVYKNVIAPYLSLTYAKNKYDLKFTRFDNKLTITRGEVSNTFYLYGGKDESSYALIQGLTLAGVLFDEVVLMCRSFVEQALARCSVEGSKYWFNCNPDSPQHWFYREWIKKCKKHNALYIHFLMNDNPSLSEATRLRYENMYAPGTFYDKYIRGEWVLAEGLVYNFFDKAIHTCDVASKLGEPSRQQSRQHDLIYCVTVDYGITNPFAALLICVDNGTAYVVKEYYYNNLDHDGIKKTDDELYEALTRLCKGYDIDYLVIDPSATSFKELIKQRGDFYLVNANNSVIAGIQYTSRMLKAGRLLIDKSCADLIREFGLYRWDDDAVSDSVIKEEDHACDALRYFCYTIYRKKFFNYLESE